MNVGLTDRQTRVLKAIIDEYIETTLPVGSMALEKKYNLGVSPATIRNEMATLTKMNYLRQPHTSAGRVPSPVAMKFYINQLMEEKKLSVAEEVKAKENVWDARNNFDQLMEGIARSLAKRTGALAVVATTDGAVWSHGHSNIFKNPETFNFHMCQTLFSMLDENKLLAELFFQRITGVSPIEILFGEELGWKYFEPVSIVATRFETKEHSGTLAAVGFFSQPYHTIIPLVRYYKGLITELNQ